MWREISHPFIHSSLVTYKLNYPSLPHFRRPRHHGYVFTQWRHRKECSFQGQCGMKLFTFCLPFLQHNPSIFYFLPLIFPESTLIFKLFSVYLKFSLLLLYHFIFQKTTFNDSNYYYSFSLFHFHFNLTDAHSFNIYCFAEDHLGRFVSRTSR